MKKILLLLTILSLGSCHNDDSIAEKTPPVTSTPQALANPDHIIFIWFENKGYSKIIGSASAPYINSLVTDGTLFTNFHALGHPSYPEYIRFFSGSDNGKMNDDCLAGSPLVTLNLYTQLKAKNRSFAWYSEDLPAMGSDTCYYLRYVERHNPTQAFANVPATANKRWADFPADYSLLENVVCISPNLDNNMHDGPIERGDEWLRINCGNLITWCKTHNSVFVVYFDEDHGTADNQIPVIAVGQPVKAGYSSAAYYDHYNMTHTILELNKAEQIGNAINKEAIKDCWK